MTKLPDYSEKKFLIVDDMPFMLDLIHRMLKECGATTIVKAPDGATVLKMIKDDVSQVDFIIADCNMAPVNGLQLLQAIRSGVNPCIPRDQAVVMLTGQTDPGVVKSAILLDVSGYLVKPISLEKLVETIERVIKKPLKVKDSEYYRAVKLATSRGLDKLLDSDTDEQRRASVWVMLPKNSQLRADARFKSKVDLFQVEHASRDGEESVKIGKIRRCDLAALTDGMVLAEDIHADEEHVLLRRGARLTTGMIDRLRELAVESKSRDHIWVGELAI